MGKILKFLHEIENGEKLDKILPSATLYDMFHFFVAKQPRPKGLAIFEYTLWFITDMKWRDLNFYKQSNPQNKVLLHAVLYKALFDTYIRHLNISFFTAPFLNHHNIPSVPETTISFEDYKKLPKHYRGIWEKSENGYVLNITKKPMVLAVQKGQTDKLIQLLRRANRLLPIIYKEKTPDIDFGGILKLYEHSISIDMVPDSLSAKRVSDEQINTIRQLHDTFIEISKITFPIKTSVSLLQTSGALQIFDEYQNELTHKNIFVHKKELSNTDQYNKNLDWKKAKTRKEYYIKKIQMNNTRVK